MSNVNIDIAKKLKLIGVKKYKECASQVEIELIWLYDWILPLVMFLRNLQKLYNNKKIGQNISVRQNIDLIWVLFFFV